MKTTLKSSIAPIFFPLVSFLFLSCSVTFYKPGNTSLYDAAKSKSKTKIIKKDGKRDIYSKIELLDNGDFYGKTKIKGEKAFDSIFIDTTTVKKVKLENTKINSSIYGITYIITFIGFLILAILYVYPWMFGS